MLRFLGERGRGVGRILFGSQAQDGKGWKGGILDQELVRGLHRNFIRLDEVTYLPFSPSVIDKVF